MIDPERWEDQARQCTVKGTLGSALSRRRGMQALGNFAGKHFTVLLQVEVNIR